MIKIKELFPKCKLHILCKKHYAYKTYKHWKLIDKFHHFGNYDILRKVNFDHVIYSYPGRTDPKLKEFLEDNTTIYARYHNNLHEVEMNIMTLKHLGWDGKNIPNIYIPIDRKVESDISLRYGVWLNEFIGVCAGWMGNPLFGKKNWGYEKYAEFIKLYMNKHNDVKIFIFGSGKDVNVLNYLSNQSRIINVVDNSIQETAAIMKHCKFVLGNDTGLMHVAASMGTKGYTIFGPTPIKKNQPYCNNTTIARKLDCQPCRTNNRWNTCKDHKCMNITPQKILDIIDSDNQEKVIRV